MPPITHGGVVQPFGGRGGVPNLQNTLIPTPDLGDVDIIKAAVTDNAKYRVFKPGAALWSAPGGVAKKVKAKTGGTAADIKAVQVIVIGTDTNDAPLTESLPALTVNAASEVISAGSFKTITSVEFPAHDGLGATTELTYEGGAAGAIIPAFTDKGVNAVHAAATMTNPDVPRNITATAGGTAGDIKAVQPIVRGTNINNKVIDETLPAFTVNTAGIVVGAKAFKTVTAVEIPPHDGTGATTSFGTGAKLGLGSKLTRNTVLNAFLGGVKEATAPTVVTDDNEVEKNTVELNSALDGGDVVIDYFED